MRPEDFDFVAKLLKDRSGLVITRDKAYLLESRLTPVARKRGLTSTFGKFTVTMQIITYTFSYTWS